jgi:hypothetical protein
MVHNFGDDKKYVTHEFEDECSQFTRGARWVGGGEYFACTYRCRIPRRIAENYDLVQAFIDRHDGDTGFWV